MDSDPQWALPPLHGSDVEANDRGLPHLPPPPADDRRPRRPRARQVSSRYLSPFPSPSSSYETLNIAASPRNPSPKIRLIQKSHPSRVSPLPESSEDADENQPLTAAVRRSSETPLPGGASSSHAKPPGTLKKKAVVRLFADNNHHEAAEQPPLSRPADPKRRQRPGTPIARPACDPPATMPRAKNRPPTRAQVSRFPYEGSVRGGDKWRSEDTLSENSFSDTETCSISSQGGFCDSPPLPPASCRSRAIAEVRSSMPEGDLLPTMSARRQDAAEHDASFRVSTNSLCLRSLSSALPNRQQQHPLNLNKSVSRPLFLLKPPQPQCAKPVTGLKKAPKSSARQEDIHMLRLLDNSDTQWRFINAKARAAEEAKRVSAERSLYGTSTRIAGLQNSIKEKKIQLEELKRRRNLLSIITHQMLHLDEWNSIEDDYSGSLSGITKALQDASFRLPITDDVKVDIRELEEVMNATSLALESLSLCTGRFQPKTEDIDVGTSNLANCTSNERVMIEECGNLLLKANRMQVKELSLRAQLIQAKQSNQSVIN